MRFTRERYQNGCLTTEQRKNGPWVWIFRWREITPEGRVNRKDVVGTMAEFPTRTAALKAVEALRYSINAECPSPHTVDQLITHYIAKELPKKAFSTRQVYRVCLGKWILPKWGTFRPSKVKAVAVEAWLQDLNLANGSKAKIRNIMSAVFKHAVRYDWLVRNPITHVRQSAKREAIPDILDAEELRRLLSELKPPYSTMVFLAATTGLRVSELLALKWEDIDLPNGEITLTRGIVQQVIGELKTEASRKPVPLDDAVADALRSWRGRSAYSQPVDWLFASPKMRGSQPYWPENVLRRYIRPAAQRVGITKIVGWHSFRRTFATLLNGSGGDVKITQELMRHSSSKITLDVYAQALTPAKRSAQKKVIELIGPPAIGAA